MMLPIEVYFIAFVIKLPRTCFKRIRSERNKNHILQINLPKQRLLLLTEEGKPKELVISKDPLKVLKDNLEKEMGKPQEEEEKE